MRRRRRRIGATRREVRSRQLFPIRFSLTEAVISSEKRKGRGAMTDGPVAHSTGHEGEEVV